MKRRFLAFLFLVGGHAILSGTEPSEFRSFSDKRGQTIEARILSIADDLRQIRLERRDGQTFELVVTLLSLDDQQFLREWLDSEEPGMDGAIRVFGTWPAGNPVNADALAEVDDAVSIHAGKPGWFVLRRSGEVLSFEDKFPGVTGVRDLQINTVWFTLARRDGKVGGIMGGLDFPELITDAVQCVSGAGHRAALLGDGSVKVWGRRYEVKEPHDPPRPLAGIVGLASNQDRVAAIHRDGRVFCWAPENPELFEATLGDGAVEIDGSIFHFLVRTRSGEVFQWDGVDPGTAGIPDALGEAGPFQKVRCNGATMAAQKEDGSWIAWGRNSSGIVDHINSLGPVADLDFFSEPGKQDLGYVIWRE